VIRYWRKLHKEELQNLFSYSSPDIRIIKSRRIRWEGQVARMRAEKKFVHVGGKA
jgi:hypothetical protein